MYFLLSQYTSTYLVNITATWNQTICWHMFSCLQTLQDAIITKFKF